MPHLGELPHLGGAALGGLPVLQMLGKLESSVIHGCRFPNIQSDSIHRIFLLICGVQYFPNLLIN